MTSQATITLLAADLDHGGVADHVKLLAQELKRRGVKVTTSERGATKPNEKNKSDREWIGLHFVSYAWARKGILRDQDIQEIKSICANRRLSIYLHELWIGESKNDPLKHRLIGWCQRRSLLRMINVLKPDHIFTSNPVYQSLLQRHEIESSILPLSGNLPPPSDSDKEAARHWLADHGVDLEEEIAVVFGTIHPEWDPTDALLAWCNHHTQQDRPATLLTLGRHGPLGASRLPELQKRIPRLKVISTGEQPATLLAGILSTASFGVATTPWALIGKSGSVAAFLEAGLPVLVTRDDWQRRDGATSEPSGHPQLWKWPSDSNFDWAAFLNSRGSAHRTIEKVATTWLHLISPTKDKM